MNLLHSIACITSKDPHFIIPDHHAVLHSFVAQVGPVRPLHGLRVENFGAKLAADSTAGY